MKEVVIKETDIIAAANEGMDSFLAVFVNAIKNAVGGELTAEIMGELSAGQITLLAYDVLHEEVMDGGFIQLIHNGYGGFIFLNPFAKVLKMWGMRDLAKLIYNGRKLYLEYKDELEKDCDDDEFMALFERYSAFDDLDDDFVEHEEEWTAMLAEYVDEHIDDFVKVER